jgi:tetratricopeptide (TPR) repeat protein
MNRRWAALCAVVVSMGLAFGAAAQSGGDTVRPEVGKPLQDAQGLLKSGRHREAMAKVNEAEAAPNRTAFENYTILRMKGAISSAAGDNDAAIKTFEAILATGRASGKDALQMTQAIAVAYYKNKDYAKSATYTQKYFKDGGTDPAMRTVLLQSYYLGNDCGAVSKLLGNVTEDTSRKPTEEELQILANCYLKQKDTAGYVAAIEKLVVYYPKKEYWTDLLARVQKKPGFSDRLSLHVLRLRMETGNLTSTDDYLEMAQLALQAGFPAEAKAVVDKGYEKKVLGTGPQAERHQRLRDLVNKSLAESAKNRTKDEQDALAAKDGNELVKVGMNYVFEGKADKGINLMEQGIKKGGLKRSEDAKLSLGYAQVHAGQKARGSQTLKGVQGTDGTADIARLWTLYARG